MKTFYSAQEIEDLARQGVRELMVDDNVVLTDLARQTAAQMGIRLVSAGAGRPGAAVAPTPAAAPQPSRSTPAPVGLPLPAKPRGCQHGPVAGADGSVATTIAARAGSGHNPGSGHVVDDLVSLVKQMGKR